MVKNNRNTIPMRAEKAEVQQQQEDLALANLIYNQKLESVKTAMDIIARTKKPTDEVDPSTVMPLAAEIYEFCEMKSFKEETII